MLLRRRRRRRSRRSYYIIGQVQQEEVEFPGQSRRTTPARRRRRRRPVTVQAEEGEEEEVRPASVRFKRGGLRAAPLSYQTSLIPSIDDDAWPTSSRPWPSPLALAAALASAWLRRDDDDDAAATARPRRPAASSARRKQEFIAAGGRDLRRGRRRDRQGRPGVRRHDGRQRSTSSSPTVIAPGLPRADRADPALTPPGGDEQASRRVPEHASRRASTRSRPNPEPARRRPGPRDHRRGPRPGRRLRLRAPAPASARPRRPPDDRGVDSPATYGRWSREVR